MKRTILSVCLTVCLAFIAVGPLAAQGRDEVIFSAMHDELQRTMTNLVMEDLDRPYFVAYTIDDIDEVDITGSLGVLTHSNQDRTRYLSVDLRVGDYALDNSNFVFGYNDRGPTSASIAIDDDYDALRQGLYMVTDRAYKSALKTLSGKKAYLQTRVIKDRPDDFLPPVANKYIDKAEPFDLEADRFEGMVRAASEVFREYPMIISSELDLSAVAVNQYLVNSAGSQVLRGDRLFIIMLTMDGKSSEGEDVHDGDHIIVNRQKDLPDKDELTRWARKQAEQMKQLLAAKAPEEYAGPVLFVGEAAGEFFRQLFVDNVSGCPSPLYDNERMGAQNRGPELANKVRRRVLPAFIDVYDDPILSSYDDHDLIGTYEVDDAGGVPQRIQLVDDGKLIDLPIGQAPTKRIKEANGHARGAIGRSATGRVSNLIVESSDQASLQDLKKSLLELAADVDLDYALIIKQLDDSNARPRGMMRFFGFGGPSGGQSALSAPLVAYKVYPDGHEEVARNLEFSNVTVRTLRDILQTGDEMQVYNYLISSDYEMPASIVCPAVLVEEMELKKSEDKVKKPPVLPSPLADQ